MTVRVLVTGAAGFIGRHVVEALLGRGHAVTACDLRPALPAGLEARCAAVHTGDLCEAGFRQACLAGMEAVCHLSALVPERPDDPGVAEACFRVNALSTLALAREAAAAGVRRFIYLSAGNAYVPQGRPCTEDDPLYPAGYGAPYLVSKLAGELYAAHACAAGGLDGLMLRVGTPYGPGEPPRKVLPTFLRRAAAGEPLTLVDGGRAAFNFIHVADVAACVAEAVAGGAPGAYNVASGEQTALREVAAIVAALHAPRPVSIVEASGPAGAASGFPALDSGRARRTWGFQPRGLRAGLADYLEALVRGGEGA